MALKIDIYPKNMEITERISDYVNKKVSKLSRFLKDIEETRVDLDLQKSMRSPADRQVAQITIRGRGYILRTEERADDIFAAIDMAIDKMQRKIERLKGKRAHGRGDGTPTAAIAQEPGTPVEIAEEIPVVVRRKSFTLAPMDEQEAIEQMKALGHETFFVFFNVDTNAINVLYTRRDGTYGLIQPILG
jgi:putative sigma-54 modulation protein